MNARSKHVVRGCLQPALPAVPAEQRTQPERHGHLILDRVDHRPEAPVFHRISTLKDGWAA
jgi:glutaminyl-tRNA synthetase